MRKVLLVEDDEMLNRGITFNLEQDGFYVKNAFTASEAEEYIKSESFNLIILDVNLPDGSGFDICEKIRRTSKAPILFLSACDMEFDIVKAFRLGGDDYVTKPFSLSILRERIFALLRRVDKEEESVVNQIICNDLILDVDKMILTKSGVQINITPTEYKLLKKFMVCKEKVLTRSILLEELWDKDCDFVDEHALTVNINRLRSKIEGKDSNVKYIKTVYGMGYMWTEREF
ncbi:MAG: response regulator transcription factor [Clostridium sp.]